jgi:hypothetical protein
MGDSPRAKLAAAMAASGGAGGRKVISSLEVNLGRSILNNQNNIRNNRNKGKYQKHKRRHNRNKSRFWL